MEFGSQTWQKESKDKIEMGVINVPKIIVDIETINRYKVNENRKNILFPTHINLIHRANFCYII